MIMRCSKQPKYEEVSPWQSPRVKLSRTGRDKRRGSNWKLTAPALVKCPQRGAFKLPHRACKACGSDHGRQVLKVDE